MELDTEFPVHKISLKTGKVTTTYMTKAEADECREGKKRETKERQEADARTAKHKAMMAYLEQLYDNRP